VPSEIRHNLFLATKEALTNCVRHAGATEVVLQITETDEFFRLVIKDNGRGFASSPTHAGADGLRNMRQRLEAIGGRFNLRTGLDGGTEVLLTYPWPKSKLSG